MDDEFLYAVRPTVPSGLRKAVLLRVDRLARLDMQRQAAGNPAARQKLLLIVALLLVGGCTFGVLRIGRLAFREAEARPTLEPGAQVVHVPQESLPAVEALGRIGFEVGLPSWTPPEYELDSQATVTLPTQDSAVEEAWQVFLFWRIRGVGTRRSIVLVSYPAEYSGSYPLPVGPGSVEVVDVGGVEGAIGRGNWIGERWEEGSGGNVWWIRGGTAYWLQSAWVSPDDLLRMASSVR